MAQRAFFTVRGLTGLVCFALAVGLSIVFFSFDPRDPSFFSDIAPYGQVPISTIGGWFGASIAEIFFRACGMSTYLISPLLLLLAFYFWRFPWVDLTRVFGGFLLFLVAVLIGGSVATDLTVAGYLGRDLYQYATSYIDFFTFLLVSAVIGVTGLISILRFSWARYVTAVGFFIFKWTGISAVCSGGYQFLRTIIYRVRDVFGRKFFRVHGGSVEPLQDDEPLEKSPFIPTSIIVATEPNFVNDQTYILPLEKLFMSESAQADKKTIEQVDKKSVRDAANRGMARGLETKLRQFGIEGSVVSITAGPTVTLFSYAPATDVKVSRIVALEDDLALAIEARSLRVIAPMPGTAHVGFEVANRTSEPVLFTELITRAPFRDQSIFLPLMLGKNITGEDRVIDLATQPHLLIAGSTGSGKSVALHTMLAGLLSSKSPDVLRFVLIDPKRLEFAGYADLAHLLVPIVTDGLVACRVLRYLTKMMENRYQQMAQAGVRNIQEYHRVHPSIEMPYIVVIIDELADLMMVAGKELDMPLVRLAQMARAAGIHLVVATQRPSVDVLTGLVKVNFPARIAFKVASKTDARTVLDQSGAERLLGRGDMLLLDPHGGLERIQGAFARDQDLKEIVSCIKTQRSADYLVIPDDKVMSGEDQETDPLMPQVIEFVRTIDEISVSLIQRRFRIGYNRSARLVDQLEHQGLILPTQGGKMRRVVRDSSVA